MCLFNFSFPIGWDELGVIATLLAVIIAFWANHQTKKQLTSALKMQEQTKNIELFDRRVGIIKSIDNNKQVSSREIKFLFGKTIYEEYLEWLAYCEKVEAAERAIRFYFEQCRVEEEKVVTIVNVKDRIEEYEMRLSLPDYPESLKEEFHQFCDSNTVFASETGLEGDNKEYNYYKLRSIVEDNSILACDTKEKVLEEMEKYIEEGMKSIS